MLSPYGAELTTELARQLGGHAVRWADNYRAACLRIAAASNRRR